MIVLNRLNITGEIDSNTPQCVLEEICSASCIKFNDFKIHKVINKIHSYPGETISEKYEILDLRKIARFVNLEHTQWKKTTLLKAYDFLTSFEYDDFCKIERTNFDFGSQTSFSPLSLNACVLYKICKIHELNLNFDTTINEMASMVKLFFSMKSNHLITTTMKLSIFDALKFSSKPQDLINMLYMMDPTFSSDMIPIFPVYPTSDFHNNVSFDDYFLIAENIQEIQEIQEQREPKDHLEAIVMAAIYHKIDISKCRNPEKEYYILCKDIYFPYDADLKRRLSRSRFHPDLLENPYLNVKFNPNFPPNMYSIEDLIKLCQDEGLQTDDPYNNLQMSYLTETFIHGKQGNIVNSETTFLEEVEDLNFDEVVVFGTRCKNSSVRAFTYGELSDTFSNYKRFTNPSTRELFTKENIDKLLILTQKERRPTESEAIYQERIDLGGEIERIQIYENSNNRYVEDFLSRYNNASDVEKEKVEHILTCLLHCAMYMRNWDGVGNFPLTSAQTNYDVEKQIIIDDRVTQSLITFEKACHELGNFGTYILKLPLMQYNYELNTFVTVNDEQEGLTIRERISIVRGGENQTGISSCIRLSSNRFCATAYFYMVLIGFNLPFNITEVSYIF